MPLLKSCSGMPGHPPRDAVEEAARDGLLERVVALLLPARDEVGPGVEARDHGGKLGRVVLQVGVERRDAAAGRAGEAGGERGALAVVAPEADAAEALVLARVTAR